MTNLLDRVEDVDTVTSSVSKVSFVLLFWRNRRRLILVGFLGMLFALGLTFLGANEYQSTAQLMPPEEGALSGNNEIGAILGSAAARASIGGELAGGYFGGRTVGGTAIGILSSRTVLDDIVNRFDLRTVYHYKLNQQARKALLGASTFTEDKKSGIITITVVDEDPNRARNIVQAYIDELTKLVNKLSNSSARNEREFLEARLKSIKDDLDTSSKALSEFSSRNATLDPEKQGGSAMEAAEKLQGELIAAQADVSELKAAYTDDNVRVRGAQKRVNELQQQLAKLTGTGNIASVPSKNLAPVIPTVRELPLLGLTYTALYRKITIEEALYEALTKEYEFAKVQEAEQIVPVKVLDPPDVPEWRNSRHRAVFMLVGLLLSLVGASVWIIVREFWRVTDDSHPAKALAIQLLHLNRRESAMSSN